MTTSKPFSKQAAPAPVQKAARMPTKTTQTTAKTPAPARTKPAPVKSATVKAVKTTAPKADKKKDKAEKLKVVRDSFTIPKVEYAQIAAMKKRAIKLGLETKKSELIRAGLLLLAATSEAAFRKALGHVPTLKTGRPGKA